MYSLSDYFPLSHCPMPWREMRHNLANSCCIENFLVYLTCVRMVIGDREKGKKNERINFYKCKFRGQGLGQTPPDRKHPVNDDFV